MPKDDPQDGEGYKVKELKQGVTGCEMMELLWKRAQECHLEEPGVVGIPPRLTHFVTCNNVPPFMQLAAIKCWEERTATATATLATIPLPFFPPAIPLRKGPKFSAKFTLPQKKETEQPEKEATRPPRH